LAAITRNVYAPGGRAKNKQGGASRINPIVVQAFEPVFETQIFRIDKRQRGVADLETLLIRIDCQVRTGSG
jgi:hypothetical protein